MKEELKFFFKTFAIGLAVILLMQLKVGDYTIEAHAMTFVHSSAVVQPLRAVASGGAKVLRDTDKWVREKINGKKQN
jgi:hypothetical protein